MEPRASDAFDPGSVTPTPRVPRRAALAAVLVAVVLVAAVFVLVRPAATPAATGSPYQTGATDWKLPRLGSSGDLTLAQFRGRPTVVDLFASWCTACQGELPLLAAASAQTTTTMNWIGVDSLETSDGLAFARQNGIGDWPLATDVNGSADSGLHDSAGGVGMPVTLFYDASGKLLHVQQGAMDAATLQATLRQLYGIDVTAPAT